MSYIDIQPATAVGRDPSKLPWGDGSWVAEPKLDGWRFLMHLGNHLDRMYLTGRRTSSVTNRLSEKGELVIGLEPEKHPSGYTVLDGEITVPGGFGDIAGFMNSRPEVAAAHIARHGLPTFHVFDLLWFDGEDLREHSYAERTATLDAVIEDELYHESINRVEVWDADESYYDGIVRNGGEGVILKNIWAPYGQRGSWIKVKRAHLLDVIVTGFTNAQHGLTGKYDGQIGAAIVSVYDGEQLVEVGKVSGMDDTTRLNMTSEPESWLGTVVEIASQNFARRRLRHPRFKRRRPDADPRHATMEKMMSDLGDLDNRPTFQLSFQGRDFK